MYMYGNVPISKQSTKNSDFAGPARNDFSSLYF